ncbi:MAG: hypothetical protein ACI8SJ_002522 [Shewanella sp.]|jgi:hypothetical protein
MKPSNILIYTLIAIASFSTQAGPRSKLTASSSESDLSLLVSQESRTLLLSCSTADSKIKTILTTNTPYAYYADDSLLIVHLNGISCQMSGESSTSTFVSSEGCEPEKAKKLRDEFQSNAPLFLELEAISMSSGRSSSAKFNIDAEAPELKSFFNKCHILVKKNASD